MPPPQISPMRSREVSPSLVSPARPLGVQTARSSRVTSTASSSTGAHLNPLHAYSATGGSRSRRSGEDSDEDGDPSATVLRTAVVRTSNIAANNSTLVEAPKRSASSSGAAHSGTWRETTTTTRTNNSSSVNSNTNNKDATAASAHHLAQILDTKTHVLQTEQQVHDTNERLAKIESLINALVGVVNRVRSDTEAQLKEVNETSMRSSVTSIREVIDQQLHTDLEPLTNALQTTITLQKTEREYVNTKLNEMFQALERLGTGVHTQMADPLEKLKVMLTSSIDQHMGIINQQLQDHHQSTLHQQERSAAALASAAEAAHLHGPQVPDEGTGARLAALDAQLKNLEELRMAFTEQLEMLSASQRREIIEPQEGEPQGGQVGRREIELISEVPVEPVGCHMGWQHHLAPMRFSHHGHMDSITGGVRDAPPMGHFLSHDEAPKEAWTVPSMEECVYPNTNFKECFAPNQLRELLVDSFPKETEIEPMSTFSHMLGADAQYPLQPPPADLTHVTPFTPEELDRLPRDLRVWAEAVK